MRIVDLIEKKKHGLEHTNEEIKFLIDSLMDGSAPDYQISAWLMAVYFNGMSEDETAYLTEAMIKSGEVILSNNNIYEFVLNQDKEINILNIPGVMLPETGGNGSKIYFIFGIILILITFSSSSYLLKWKEGG